MESIINLSITKTGDLFSEVIINLHANISMVKEILHIWNNRQVILSLVVSMGLKVINVEEKSTDKLEGV